MLSKNLKWRVPLPLVLLVLGSCAVRSPEGSSPPAQQQQVIQTIQANDNQLTCDELLTQMAQMDQIAYGSPAGGDGTKSTIMTALMTGANVGFGFIPIPGVGSVLGAVTRPLSGTVGSAGQQQMQQQNRIVQAQQRKQHLVTLYDEEKCYARSASPQSH